MEDSPTPNTYYTYKAYSDSNRSTELAAAPAFPTLPPKPTDLIATAHESGDIFIPAWLANNSVPTTWQYIKKAGAGDFETTWTDIGTTSWAGQTSGGLYVTGLTDGTTHHAPHTSSRCAGRTTRAQARRRTHRLR